MIPGQFGPINVDEDASTTFFTLTISLVGIPSVIQIISSMPASVASRIASGANAAGTKIRLVLAALALRASTTESNTSKPSTSVPPFPGVTPPTTLVPYSLH